MKTQTINLVFVVYHQLDLTKFPITEIWSTAKNLSGANVCFNYYEQHLIKMFSYMMKSWQTLKYTDFFLSNIHILFEIIAQCHPVTNLHSTHGV